MWSIHSSTGTYFVPDFGQTFHTCTHAHISTHHFGSLLSLSSLLQSFQNDHDIHLGSLFPGLFSHSFFEQFLSVNMCWGFSLCQVLLHQDNSASWRFGKNLNESQGIMALTAHREDDLFLKTWVTEQAWCLGEARTRKRKPHRQRPCRGSLRRTNTRRAEWGSTAGKQGWGHFGNSDSCLSQSVVYTNKREKR